MTIPLTPDIIEDSKTKARGDRAAIVRDLASEEERLVRSVNDLRLEEQEEIRKKAEREAANQGPLAVRKTILEQEVDSLESRKRDALKPVSDRFKEADELYERNQANATTLAKQKEDQNARGTAIEEKESEIIKRDLDSRTRETDLDRRDISVEAAEAEVRRSSNELAQKWVAYNAKAQDDESALATRTADVEAAAKANEIRAKALDEREKGYIERENGITKRYAFLELAEADYKKKHPDHD